MLRFTPAELARIKRAHEESQGAAQTWNRLKLAAWLRRTLLNLHPDKPASAKTRSRKRAA